MIGEDRAVRRGWRLPLFASLALLAGLLLGADRPASAERISIAYQPIVNGPLWIARHEGYFDALGLEVEFIKFSSGPPQFAALQGGRVDLAWGGMGTFLLAHANGAGLNWIASVMDYNPLEALVVPGPSPFRSVKELAGKSVGLVTGSDAQYGILKALQLNGMAPDAVRILNMQPPQQVQALLNGDIDAAFTWSPFLNQLTDRGARTLFSNGQLPVGPAYLGWAGKKDWLDRNAGALVKLFKGWDKGLQKMREAPELAVKYSVEYVGIDPAQAKAMQDELRYFEAAAMLDPQSRVYWSRDSLLHGLLEDIVAYGMEYKLIKAPVPVDEYVTTRFIEAYARQAGK